MNYMNATTKTEAQIEALLAADDGAPICMVNLLKFRIDIKIKIFIIITPK